MTEQQREHVSMEAKLQTMRGEDRYADAQMLTPLYVTFFVDIYNYYWLMMHACRQRRTRRLQKVKEAMKQRQGLKHSDAHSLIGYDDVSAAGIRPLDHMSGVMADNIDDIQADVSIIDLALEQLRSHEDQDDVTQSNVLSLNEDVIEGDEESVRYAFDTTRVSEPSSSHMGQSQHERQQTYSVVTNSDVSDVPPSDIVEPPSDEETSMEGDASFASEREVDAVSLATEMTDIVSIAEYAHASGRPSFAPEHFRASTPSDVHVPATPPCAVSASAPHCDDSEYGTPRHDDEDMMPRAPLVRSAWGSAHPSPALTSFFSACEQTPEPLRDAMTSSDEDESNQTFEVEVSTRTMKMLKIHLLSICSLVFALC